MILFSSLVFLKDNPSRSATFMPNRKVWWWVYIYFDFNLDLPRWYPSVRWMLLTLVPLTLLNKWSPTLSYSRTVQKGCQSQDLMKGRSLQWYSQCPFPCHCWLCAQPYQETWQSMGHSSEVLHTLLAVKRYVALLGSPCQAHRHCNWPSRWKMARAVQSNTLL